ncbi:MAG TPA: hypothetical protein VIH16_06255 [Bellilinea sp.]
MEATSWKHLPYAGGLLDQPEWLMDDLFTLAGEMEIMKKVK